ncbi:CrcB family protein [Mumia zhuanghuii]|uniref:Fluoride-specific ion channel FluC n=2 Tax=Mumia zhuanghuii TaxID=2585211 RepID=A0A5C4MQ22_9ACTN|nr:CrcB family protein [Mumia zhuanghuii]TNC48880.1 CrcB family protein [Mumia zhuanghuii]
MAVICLCGGLGAACRFVLDTAVRRRWSTRMPWGTILVNVSGSLLIGALAAAYAGDALGARPYLVAGVGFCGGYTTFSTAMVETVRLAQDGDFRRAVVNVVGTTAVTCAAAASAYAAVTGLT